MEYDVESPNGRLCRCFAPDYRDIIASCIIVEEGWLTIKNVCDILFGAWLTVVVNCHLIGLICVLLMV
ncbi:hypothetical protein P8452_62488 [Trifolium repens]|nr:hypothetical protein P8452_62488 [Trifolium repens]